MRDLIDFARRRPLLCLILILIAVALAIVAVLIGARIWQALLGVFGLGVGAAQPLRVYVRKDQERLQSQVEIDEWKARRKAEIHAEAEQAERKTQERLTAKLNGIDKAVETETPEQLRKRLLDAARGPLQAVVWLALFIPLAGCTSLAGGAAGTQVRDICFTRTEAGDLLKTIETMKALVKQCEGKATSAQRVASVECQALVARWQLEARSCADKLAACSARTCPTCWLPWLIVGVSLAATATVAVYAGVQVSRSAR